MANTRLTRAAATPTSPQKATMSFWIKRSGLSSAQSLIDWYEDGNNFTRLAFQSDDVLKFSSKDGNNVYGQLTTNRNFRDTSGWYNIIVAIDTTQATASNRMKMYINGVQETSFSTETQPVQNRNFKFDAAKTIGANGAAGEYYNGSMSFITYVDGTQELPTVFGSTDSTTGEWKINTSPSATYGNNGFLILKNGNSVEDESGNSNDFSYTSGTLTNTEDCPDNVFATLNPLDRWGSSTVALSAVLSSGNTQFNTGTNSVKAVARTTLGMSKGKYYCELKIPQIERTWIGINNSNFYTSSTNNFWTTNLESGFFWYGNGTAIYNSNDVSYDTYGAYANDDIVMMALDMDNYAFYLGKNGSWLNSGNPESGSSKTGSVTGLTDFGTNPLTNYGEVFFMVGDSSTAGTANTQWNFGNGVFGTTAVASAGTNASANGIFEYDVPTGYTALSTKGLNL